MKSKTLLKSCLAVAIAAGMSANALADEATYTISGWLNEGITYYDDGVSTDVAQLGDNGTTLGSRISLTGAYKPDTGPFSFGFEVIVEPTAAVDGNSASPLLSNQEVVSNANSFGSGISLLSNNVYVSGDFGKVTIGTQSMPTDNIAVLADPSVTIWSGISPLFRTLGFTIFDSTGAAVGSWGQFAHCLGVPGLGIGIDCNGIYRNGIRYDLPAFGDFSVAVGYANDNVFDAAVKYSGEVGGLKLMANLGYSVNADGGVNTGTAVLGGGSETLQFQVGLMDPNSGFFGTFAYQVEETDEDVTLVFDGDNYSAGDDTDSYHLKVGIRKAFNELGDSAFYVDYAAYNDQYGATAGLTGSELNVLGFAAEQYFGGRFLIYGKYEIISVDAEGAAAVANPINDSEDLHLFQLGATIFF